MRMSSVRLVATARLAATALAVLAFVAFCSLRTSGPPTPAEVARQVDRLAVPFVANAGQSDPRVAYSASTFSGTVFVTKEGELVYALPAPGRRGSSRTGERLDADGAVRRWSFDPGRGALRGNARERLRRRRPGALAAGRRELYRRGPGCRVARHLRRADRAREAGGEGLHGRARRRARRDPGSGGGRGVARGRRRRRAGRPHGRGRRAARAAGRLSVDRGDAADGSGGVRDRRRRVRLSRARLRPDATGRDRPAAPGNLSRRQRCRPGLRPRDRTDDGRRLRGRRD